MCDLSLMGPVSARTDQILYRWSISFLRVADLHTRACHICWLPAWFAAWLLVTFEKTEKEEDQATGKCESLKNKMFGWWSGGALPCWRRVSDKRKVASYLDLLSPVKAFRCSAPLSGFGRAKLEQLFLFLAADERTESDPDSWDYIGIWVTHYCHPNMCHPPRLWTLGNAALYVRAKLAKQVGSLSVPYD